MRWKSSASCRNSAAQWLAQPPPFLPPVSHLKRKLGNPNEAILAICKYLLKTVLTTILQGFKLRALVVAIFMAKGDKSPQLPLQRQLNSPSTSNCVERDGQGSNADTFPRPSEVPN